MNIIVVMDHYGLFIYIDLKYSKSYHDIIIFHLSNIHKIWLHLFFHTNEYFEYLLDDLGYMGKETFVMHRIRKCEFIPKTNLDVIKVFKKVHACIFILGLGFKVWVVVFGLSFEFKF